MIQSPYYLRRTSVAVMITTTDVVNTIIKFSTFFCATNSVKPREKAKIDLIKVL